MKFHKTILIVLLLISCFASYSQTKMIAYKSHSGSGGNLKMEGDDNFGIIAPRIHIDTIIMLSDTSAMQIARYDHGWWRSIDTIYYNSEYANVSLDSLKKVYPRTVFIGFNKSKSLKKSETGHQREGVFFYFILPDGSNGTPMLILCLLLFSFLFAYLLWRKMVKNFEASTTKAHY